MALQRILHYRVLEEVGRGGMGVVYQAMDERLDRQVAIKVLKAHQDAKHRNQFVWEAQAAARLRHPNIIVVHDIGEENGADFIVMEFVKGRALSEIIPDDGMPIRELLRCAAQVSSALEAAHSAGVIHRDIKPSQGKNHRDRSAWASHFDDAVGGGHSRRTLAGDRYERVGRRRSDDRRRFSLNLLGGAVRHKQLLEIAEFAGDRRLAFRAVDRSRDLFAKEFAELPSRAMYATLTAASFISSASATPA